MDRALGMLRSPPGVVYAEPNYLIEAADYTPADPGFLEQWGLDNTGQDSGTAGCDINAAAAWDLEKGATNPVTVAVIDTGIDLGHPDLTGKLVPGYNWAGISQTRFQQETPRHLGDAPERQKFAQSIKGTGQPLSDVGLRLRKDATPLTHIHVSL